MHLVIPITKMNEGSFKYLDINYLGVISLVSQTEGTGEGDLRE